jgi:hypothetical protein
MPDLEERNPDPEEFLRREVHFLAASLDRDPARIEEFGPAVASYLHPGGPPTEPRARRLLAELLPYPTAAEIVCRQIIVPESTPGLLLEVARTAWLLGCDELMEQALGQARPLLASNDPDWLHLHAQTRADPAERLTAYQQIVELHPQDKRAWEAILSLTR